MLHYCNGCKKYLSESNFWRKKHLLRERCKECMKQQCQLCLKFLCNKESLTIHMLRRHRVIL